MPLSKRQVNSRLPNDGCAMILRGGISEEQRRALRLLARSPTGRTEAMLQARGFTNKMLATLVQDGFATAALQTVHLRKGPLEVVRMQITDSGRQAIAR
jgi:hypothetical protein